MKLVLIIKIIAAYLLYAAAGLAISLMPTGRRGTSEAGSARPCCRQGNDRIMLFDDPVKSGLARLALIQGATSSLHVAYFAVEPDASSDAFVGALLAAADRGVAVHVVLDGIFHGFRTSRRAIAHVLAHHPRIQLRYYEPFNPLLPWMANYRMHDKMMIADGHIAMTGGRNIGDRYFDPEWYDKPVTHDRDVVIVRSEARSDSVLEDFSNYFQALWQHPHSRPARCLPWRSRRRQMHHARSLKEIYETVTSRHQDYISSIFSDAADALPAQSISFIHNPLARRSKEPHCWRALVEYSKAAEQSVFIQSPYTVPHKKMIKGYFAPEDLARLDITLLTNSLASTPNLVAFAGYLNYRQKIVDHNVRILELQSEDSVHSKAFLIDEDLSIIGSFNLDPRSAFLSTESMVVIRSKPVADALKRNLVHFIDHSLVVGAQGEYKPCRSKDPYPTSVLKRSLVTLLAHGIRFFDYLL